MNKIKINKQLARIVVEIGGASAAHGGSGAASGPAAGGTGVFMRFPLARL